ncbi:hypothetical protein FOPE_05187 [Fonsecaea pedrosoi]|nr:hypothetical protein FOPE_05187 [Fonsecaea pedrosoi]
MRNRRYGNSGIGRRDPRRSARTPAIQFRLSKLLCSLGRRAGATDANELSVKLKEEIVHEAEEEDGRPGRGADGRVRIGVVVQCRTVRSRRGRHGCGSRELLWPILCLDESSMPFTTNMALGTEVEEQKGHGTEYIGITSCLTRPSLGNLQLSIKGHFLSLGSTDS